MKRTFNLLVLVTLLALTFGTYGVTPAYAATQSIGGTAVTGNLRVDVYDNGAMAIGQYDGAIWQENIYGISAKGSTLCVATTRYDMGGNSTWSPSSPNPATWVSNTGGALGTGSIVTTWTAGGMTIVQTTSYTDGNQYYTIEWAITNTSGADINDLRLFNGQDTLLAGSDIGTGWWNGSLGAYGSIGVTHPSNGQEMWLQPVSEAPFNYESQTYYNSRANVNSCALNGTVDAAIHDNGYALEFRRATLANGATWTVTVEEHFIPQQPADTTPPVVTVPANMTVPQTIPAGAVVNFTATAIDETSPANPPVVCVPASGSTFPLGTTPVTCSATDDAGNTGYGYFDVTVTAAASGNLLKKPDFANAAIFPTPWQAFGFRKPYNNVLDCNFFNMGPCSVLFIAGNRSAMQQVNRSGVAGDDYSFGIYSAANAVPAGGKYLVEVAFFDTFNRRVGPLYQIPLTIGTHGFELFSGPATVTGNYNKIFFRFYYHNPSGRAWFDDAFLYALP